MDLEERKLITNAIQGDEVAFEMLFLRHSKKLYSVAYRLCNNAADAQDIVQESMIKAWQHLNRFRFESEFSTWLYRITINTAKDKLRKNKKTQVSLDTLKESGYELSDDGFETASNTKRDIRKALMELSVTHRTVLILRDVEGFSYEEIAEMLKLPVGTVRSRINRARKQLRKFYLGEGTISEDKSSKEHKVRTDR